MLAMIGESFEHAQEICGAVVSIRKSQHRVSLWTRTADDEILTTSVGMTWKALMNVPVPIQYQVSADRIFVEWCINIEQLRLYLRRLLTISALLSSMRAGA